MYPMMFPPGELRFETEFHLTVINVSALKEESFCKFVGAIGSEAAATEVMML